MGIALFQRFAKICFLKIKVILRILFLHLTVIFVSHLIQPLLQMTAPSHQLLAETQPSYRLGESLDEVLASALPKTHMLQIVAYGSL